MEIISKVKNILLNPKTEWEVISEKNDTHSKVLVSYLIPWHLSRPLRDSLDSDSSDST